MERNAHRGMNFGSGPTLALGWFNVDREQYHAPGGAFFHADVLRGFPWADDYFDGIVANHSLQCLTVHELPIALAEFKRVLRPDGRLRVIVPDVVGAFVAWQRGLVSWAGFEAISGPWSLDRKLSHYLTWGGQNRSTFTGEALEEVLDEAGFFVRDTAPDDGFEWLRALDTRQGESVILEAIRP